MSCSSEGEIYTTGVGTRHLEYGCWLCVWFVGMEIGKGGPGCPGCMSMPTLSLVVWDRDEWEEKWGVALGLGLAFPA
jgi:hypothetical protein